MYYWHAIAQVPIEWLCHRGKKETQVTSNYKQISNLVISVKVFLSINLVFSTGFTCWTTCFDQFYVEEHDRREMKIHRTFFLYTTSNNYKTKMIIIDEAKYQSKFTNDRNMTGCWFIRITNNWTGQCSSKLDFFCEIRLRSSNTLNACRVFIVSQLRNTIPEGHYSIFWRDDILHHDSKFSI